MEATETVVTAPSAEPVVEEKPQQNPLELGPMVNWTREQRQEFRSTGKTPEKVEEKPKADPAPADKSSEASAESAAASEAAKQQENTEKPHKPKQTAEERIAQLEATIEKIRKGAGLERKAEDAPASQQPKQEPAQPQTYQDYRKAFKPSQWIEDFAKANPEASYEDATAAMADHLADVREGFRQREQQQQAEIRHFSESVEKAKSRYGDEGISVIDETAGQIISDRSISPVVTQMLRESEVLPDLLYTLGSKPEELANFAKMARENPGKALRYIALTETLIREELEGQKAPAEKVTPAKPQPPAPKVPVEVGGRGSAPPDTLVSAAQANDFRAFKAELNRRALARLKG